MTPEHVQLVQSTWAKVKPISSEAAALFYGRLFELYPESATLFRSEMGEQGDKLMGMIDFAVGSLNDLAPAVPAIEDLGARHAGYGVIDADYDKVAEALLWTLGKGLGADFTPEVEAAWASVYGALADTMKEGAARRD